MGQGDKGKKNGIGRIRKWKEFTYLDFNLDRRDDYIRAKPIISIYIKAINRKGKMMARKVWDLKERMQEQF